MTSSEVKWIAGFTSADGTIAPMIKKQEDVSIGYNLSLRIRWEQNPDPIVAGFLSGDGGIEASVKRRRGRGFRIQPIVQFSNCCSLMIEDLSSLLDGLDIKHRKYNDARDSVAYINVQRFEDVKKLLEITLPYLLGSKSFQAQIMLDEIIPRMEEGKHKTKEGFLEIMKYIDKLNALKGGKRGKYNRNFFIGLWGLI